VMALDSVGRLLNPRMVRNSGLSLGARAKASPNDCTFHRTSQMLSVYACPFAYSSPNPLSNIYSTPNGYKCKTSPTDGLSLACNLVFSFCTSLGSQAASSFGSTSSPQGLVGQGCFAWPGTPRHSVASPTLRMSTGVFRPRSVRSKSPSKLTITASACSAATYW